MRVIASMSFDGASAYTETRIALLALTEDAKEGLEAFAEKRKPVWPEEISVTTLAKRKCRPRAVGDGI
jgi:hypothetical protein